MTKCLPEPTVHFPMPKRDVLEMAHRAWTRKYTEKDYDDYYAWEENEIKKINAKRRAKGQRQLGE